MGEKDSLAGRFEEHRARLRAVAYRMLGSFAEADDAVQETWLKLQRADVSGVRNPGGWLTTVVSRVCLDMLRARGSRREEPLSDAEEPVRMPDPVISGPDGVDPEHAALVADSVGFALMVVLQTLSPAERVAFVLHDLFALPFDAIADVLDRTPASTRQLASRARRRVDRSAPPNDTDPAQRRRAMDAFLAAARAGDFEGLLAVLDPDVVARSDGGALRPSLLRRGAADVASQAITFSRFATAGHPVLVNGSPGVVGVIEGRVVSVMAFTVRGSRITAMDSLTDPERLARIDLAALGGGRPS